MNGPPPRPPIPPIAWFAVALWAGCVAAEQISWVMAQRVAGIPESAQPLNAGAGVAVTLLACSLIVIVRIGATALVTGRPPRARASLAAMACAGMVLGAALSGLQAATWHRQQATVADAGAREWTGIVEADPMPGAYGTVARIRLTGGPLDGARVRVGWPAGELTPELGRSVRFSAILKLLPASEIWARRMARTGVCATGTAWRAETGAWRTGPTGPLFAWRARTLERLHAIPGPGGDLTEGIVLGDRRRLLGTTTEEDFRVLGLTHLVAVSGSHLALACAAVAFLGAALRLPRRPHVLATVAAGATYAVVTGLPYSALRSLFMLVVGGAGQMAGRRGDGVASLAVAAVCVLVMEPWAVFDLGFQLSALAVAGLLLYGSLITEWVTTGVRGVWRAVTGTLALTLVAQMTTVPVVASGFGMVSLLAPVANAVVGPLVSLSLLLGLGGVVAGELVPPVGGWATQAAASVLGATAWLAGRMAQLPGAAIAMNGGPVLFLFTLCALAALWLWWPLPRNPRAGPRLLVGVAVFSVALAVGPAPAREASVTVLDVGQGDAVLVRDGGRTMLVDVGPDALRVRQALARRGIRSIDVLILTHAHADHAAGAPGISGVADVGWIGVPALAVEDEATTLAMTRPGDAMPGDENWRGPDTVVRRIGAGDAWNVGEIGVRVLWPPSEDPGELETNDTSIVLLLSRGPIDVVLTGDGEKAVQDGIISAGAMRSIEVLKVPHHGSRNGLTAEGLAGWAPDVALISVGAANDFGHPSRETLDMLDAAGVRTFRTDHSGDITVVMDGQDYRVRVSRRGGVGEVRARMGNSRPNVGLAAITGLLEPRKGASGHHNPGRTEAGLLDLRGRGAAARSRAPPP